MQRHWKLLSTRLHATHANMRVFEEKVKHRQYNIYYDSISKIFLKGAL